MLGLLEASLLATALAVVGCPEEHLQSRNTGGKHFQIIDRLSFCRIFTGNYGFLFLFFSLFFFFFGHEKEVYGPALTFCQALTSKLGGSLLADRIGGQ